MVKLINLGKGSHSTKWGFTGKDGRYYRLYSMGVYQGSTHMWTCDYRDLDSDTWVHFTIGYSRKSLFEKVVHLTTFTNYIPYEGE